MMTPTTSGARRVFSTLFVCAVVLLGLATIALRPVLGSIAARYTKQSIELRKELNQFDYFKLASFGLFEGPVENSADRADLGTDHYAFYIFVNRTIAADPVWEDELGHGLFMTYYSNPRDRVPHTPEVCARQGGYVINGIDTTTFEMPALHPKDTTITAKLIDMDTDTGRQALLYIFYCNGRSYSDREQTRLAIGMPGDTHVYFSKVEAFSVAGPGEEFDHAVARCEQLLREALQILIADHFPADEDVRAR